VGCGCDRVAGRQPVTNAHATADSTSEPVTVTGPDANPGPKSDACSVTDTLTITYPLTVA
jgi:hypothetical protein